jgi:hypothetical protein
MGICQAGKVWDGLVFTLTGLALSDSPFFLLPEDLVAQNIDVVLNRRSCMAATLRIIEENIPEVRALAQYSQLEEAGWDSWDG